MTNSAKVSLVGALARWAELEPERCRAPHEAQHTPGWHVNACGSGANWARLSFTSGPERNGFTTPTHEALGLVTAAIEQGMEARGWCWHTHNTGPAGHRSHCAQVYPSKSALSGMFQGHGDSPAHALLLGYLAALEAEQ